MRATLDFLLFDWLQADALCQRERFAEHSRDTFVQVLDTCERVAAETFAPANRACDTAEPFVDEQGRVQLPASTAKAQSGARSSGSASSPAKAMQCKMPKMITPRGSNHQLAKLTSAAAAPIRPTRAR
jgi:butyryl-CoA dehydrogenase